VIYSYLDEGVAIDLVPLAHRRKPERNLFSADSFTLVVGKNGAGKTHFLSALAGDLVRVRSNKLVRSNTDESPPYVILYTSSPFVGARPAAARHMRQLGPRSKAAKPDPDLLSSIAAAFSTSGRPEVKLSTDFRSAVRAVCAALYEIPMKVKAPASMELDGLLGDYQKISRQWVSNSSQAGAEGVEFLREQMVRHQRAIGREVERWLRRYLGVDLKLFMHALDLCIKRNKRKRNAYVQHVFDIAEREDILNSEFAVALGDVQREVAYYGSDILTGRGVQVPQTAAYEFDPNSDVISLAIGPSSSGSAALLDQFSKIYDAIKHVPSEVRSLFLLIDEGDAFLHFEWQQKYVKFLDEFIKRIRNRFAYVQVVLATHSPILMSDVPRDNVLRIGEEELPICTFGAPLERIVSTTGEAGSIGEFAADRIREIIRGERPIDEYLLSQIDDGIIRSELKRILVRDQHPG